MKNNKISELTSFLSTGKHFSSLAVSGKLVLVLEGIYGGT